MKHLLIVEDGQILFSAPIEKFVVSVDESKGVLTAKLSQDDNAETDTVAHANIWSGYSGPI